MKRFLLLALTAGLSLPVQAEDNFYPPDDFFGYDERDPELVEEPDINNFAEKCSSEKIQEFGKSLDYLNSDSDFLKAKNYQEKCDSLCMYMKPIYPEEEGFLFSGNYGIGDRAFCVDTWHRKIQKRGDRLEYESGQTSRQKGLNGKPQKAISDYWRKMGGNMSSLVNCSTWERWNKSEKIWEPIRSNTIPDIAAKEFCD